MVHRNSIYERQLKLGSTRALACSDWRPPPVGHAGSHHSKKPVFQLIPGYSSLCPWGEGVSNGGFYTSVSARPATNARLPSPIANRKSQIKNSSMPPSLQNSTTPIRPLPSGWGQLSTARPSFHPSPENRKLGNAR